VQYILLIIHDLYHMRRILDDVSNMKLLAQRMLFDLQRMDYFKDYGVLFYRVLNCHKLHRRRIMKQPLRSCYQMKLQHFINDMHQDNQEYDAAYHLYQGSALGRTSRLLLRRMFRSEFYLEHLNIVIH